MSEFDVDYEALLKAQPIRPADLGRQQVAPTESAIERVEFRHEVLDFTENDVVELQQSSPVAEEFTVIPEPAAVVATGPAWADEELISDLARIPDRLGFKIGDVAALAGIKTHILRYWESEFELLRPQKSKNNQRMFTKKDVENVMLVKKLLQRDKFSVEGAKAALKNLKQAVKAERPTIDVRQRQLQVAQDVRALLKAIQALRRSLAAQGPQAELPASIPSGAGSPAAQVSVETTSSASCAESSPVESEAERSG